MVGDPPHGRAEIVRDFPDVLVERPNVVPAGAPLSRAVEALLERPESRAVYVTDAEGKLVGVVSFRSLLRVLKARYGAVAPGPLSFLTTLRDLLPEKVEDVMRPVTPIRAETPVKDALLLLEDTRQNDLPLVDEQGRVVGELNGMHVMRLALRVLRNTENPPKRGTGDI